MNVNILSGSRAWLRSVAVSDSTTNQFISNIGVVTSGAVRLPGAVQMDGIAGVQFTGVSRVPSAAEMDGQAQMAVTGSGLFPGAAEMDGHGSMLGSTVAVTTSAAEMDGQAQMAAVGVAGIKSAAQMNGAAAMVAITVVGAGTVQMNGQAQMAAVGSFIGPNIYPMSLSDGIIGNQVNPVPSSTYHLGLFENILGGSTTKTLVRYHTALAQNVGLADRRVLRFVQKLRETIVLRINFAMHTQFHYILTEPIRVAPAPVPVWNRILELVQNVGISQATSEKFIWGRMLADIVKVSSIVSASGIYHKSLSALFKFVEAFNLRRDIILNQNIGIHPSLAATSFLKLLQTFLVASSSSPVFNYHLILAGRIIVADILGHFTSAILTQLFTVHPSLNRQYVANNSLAQLLTVHPALTNKLILQIVGNLQLSPSQLVHMLYRGDPLLDGVVIQALYISPSGTTTTWAVNTRTNAVTEYLNYDFQSFALMDNRYIAAGPGGLYELDGDTDNGALIISELMSGYLQLNEKKLFGIKGAYVAIRGDGRFYLKLISGDGREYVYELKAQPNLMTTKVRIGKGISTTYMAFDLVTEGQDWDLDSIEFIPMTRGRRV
jgi:hypothetical protein